MIFYLDSILRLLNVNRHIFRRISVYLVCANHHIQTRHTILLNLFRVLLKRGIYLSECILILLNVYAMQINQHVALPGQPSSSVPSPQSSFPSHFNVSEMHFCDVQHLNSVQPSQFCVVTNQAYVKRN